MTCFRIGNVPHLCFRDIQQLGKLRPVGGRLVQQDQKLAVGEHEPGRIGPQTFLHVLRCPGHGRRIFAKPLPALIEELGGVVILEKQVDFVNEDPCVLSGKPVCGHPVLNGLQHHVHSGGL